MIDPKRRLPRNIFFNWMGLVLTAGIAFYLNPFLVHHLGTEQFGIWALCFSILAYTDFFDVGVRQSLARYLPKYYGVQDYENMNRVLNTGNLIYGNNIIRNSKQASVYLANRWDNGFEGNFWSDYSGVDADHNGITDVPLMIGDNNTDNQPLMGPMHVFTTPLGFDVDVISNSSIAAFDYFDTNGTIRMDITDPTKPGDYGFCRMRIPHALMTEPFSAFVDGANPLYWNYTLRGDGDNQWIYFAYQRSPHIVLIEGTPRSRGQDLFWYLIAAAITVFAVVVAVIVVYYLKLRKRSSQTTGRV